MSFLIAFLIMVEGLKLTIYKDVGGAEHVGVGHKLTPVEAKTRIVHDIDISGGITKEQAIKILKVDVAARQALLHLRGIDTSGWSKEQKTALISYIFNVGLYSFLKSNGYQCFLQYGPQKQCYRHLDVMTVKGKLHIGLVNRRLKEWGLVGLGILEI